MPEGDTIFRAARTLNRMLAGQPVTRFESTLPHLLRVHVDRVVTGRIVESVVSRGKHLLMTLSNDLVLHTHMRMHGTWHVYRPEDRWQRPARDMRVVLATPGVVAVAFNVPLAEFLTSRQLARHQQLHQLGPDLADAAVEADAVRIRMRACENEAVADVLLNQRVLSGIGNVLKSETLFASRVNPFRAISDLSDNDLNTIVRQAQRLMAMNTRERGAAASPQTIARQTTGSMNTAALLWVYGRAGKPCRICGSPIASQKSGPDARVTYWCARCQPS
jgi:endonuclease-8